jgi:lysosomal Pro-X carboxypeptidase
MVMPMCNNGKDDFFEPTDWNYKEYELKCEAKWKVKPRPWMAEIMYGGKNLQAASNIVFRSPF